MFRCLDQFCQPRTVPYRNRVHGVMPNHMQITCPNQKYPAIDNWDHAITTRQTAIGE